MWVAKLRTVISRRKGSRASASRPTLGVTGASGCAPDAIRAAHAPERSPARFHTAGRNPPRPRRPRRPTLAAGYGWNRALTVLPPCPARGRPSGSSSHSGARPVRVCGLADCATTSRPHAGDRIGDRRHRPSHRRPGTPRAAGGGDQVDRCAAASAASTAPAGRNEHGQSPVVLDEVMVWH